MDRRITGFHQDEEQHWVAELECGHTQHVRHDPPWQLRPWVVDEATRRERLGTTLACVECDAPPAALRDAGELPLSELDPYTDARIRGLCEDGAAEAARRRRRES